MKSKNIREEIRTIIEGARYHDFGKERVIIDSASDSILSLFSKLIEEAKPENTWKHASLSEHEGFVYQMGVSDTIAELKKRIGV